MSIVVLNYMYMKETTLAQLLLLIQSMFSTHCFAHLAVSNFEMVFFLKIITNKITEAKFSCLLSQTTKLSFSPAQEQLK